ncbi:DEAD/DEAH box helicase family protein [bacterium]|nr:DEAD/DEAH box helicase family protein [bacterium]
MKTATLVVKDEVNVKIEGLDLEARKRLSNKFKYEVPYARYLPAVRLGRWDGKVSYFQLGGSSFINLLPDILPMLTEMKYDIALDDHREYQTEFVFEPVTAETFSHKKWPEGHVVAGEPVVLRDYQIEIINNFISNPQSLQEIATGAGKTLITAALSNLIEPYGRSIVIVPNKSLVTQTEEDYVNLGLDVGVYYGDRKEFGRTHTICTWQSLNILLKNTRNAEAPITIGEFIEDVVCVIVDEVHMAKADALKTLLTGVMSQIPVRWGLTGTIPKEMFEFMSLLVSLGPVTGRKSASELQDMGVLANCEVNVVQLIDHGDYSNYQSELKYLLTNEKRLDYLASMFDTIGDSGNTMVLVDRVESGKALVSRLGERAVFISGATKAGDRKEHYDQIADVNNKIIVATYGVAAVGINIPRIFNLVLLEPGKSFVRVIQSIGRGIRKAEDKDHVQIWDITSTCKYAKRHLTKRKQFYKEANYPFVIQKTDWN